MSIPGYFDELIKLDAMAQEEDSVQATNAYYAHFNKFEEHVISKAKTF